MKIFQKILILLMASASLLHAGIRLELSRRVITTDDRVSLLLKFDPGDRVTNPRIPFELPDGLEFVGFPSLENITINGVSDNRVRYTIKPTQEGEFKIGPFKVEGNGKDEIVEAVTLTVKAASVIQSTENLFVTLESSSEEMLVNETVELTLSFYSRVNTGKIKSEDFEEKGFEISEWQGVQTAPKVIGGQTYNVERFTARLTPTKTGILSIDPSFQIEVRERQASSGIFYSPYSIRVQRIKLKHPLVLKVKNPPTAGRPEDYAGHLGNFRLSASVSPREVDAGDPVTLRVELSGSGSLQQALPPGLKENEDFKVYEPKLIVEDFERNGLTGRKISEQVLIPKHAGITEIPALTFSYYDTDSKSYKTIQSGPFPIQVNESHGEGDASIISSLPQETQTRELTLLGDDLIYLKTRPGKIKTVDDLQPGIAFVGLSSLPFALWAFLGLIVHKQQRNDADPTNRRRQEAPRRLRKHLQQLDESGGEVYTRIWLILSEYLSARLNLPPGELNPNEVTTILREKIDDDTLTEGKEWMRKCEQARFAGNTSDIAPEEVRDQFRAFILKLDRELGK